MEYDASLWSLVRSKKYGVFLYVSSSPVQRHNSLELMIRACLCEIGQPTNCKCASCQAIQSGSLHPELITISAEMFDTTMVLAYSYPTPVIALPSIHDLKGTRQTQLLIWLEMIASKHSIIMTTRTLEDVLPTIQSRAFIYRQNTPDEIFSEEDSARAEVLINRLSKGELRIDDSIHYEEGQKLASAMRFLLIRDFELRVAKSVIPDPRQYPLGKVMFGTISTQELQTLVRLLNRYLESPPHHNLTLLLKSYQMLVLRNIR